ncbi:MAG: hypothetical protein J2P18_22530 [Nocardia sp.]|nr:hypothetical protein [Nocardia sp.]
MRYRLGVVAPTVAEVVGCAGGWLFDRGMAGWQVTVIVGDHTGARALQILGADVLDLEEALAATTRRPDLDAVAITGEVFESDQRIRCGVLEVLELGDSELSVLGERCPSELARHVDIMQHRLSFAAQAFKSQALAALGGSRTPVGALETFHTGAPVWAPPVDLVPVAG